MGTPNRNNNNYINNMINQFGENWITALTPEDIQRSTKRIIKDMVRGSYNYEEVGKYFLDGKFLSNIIIATQNELQSNILYRNALMFYKNYYPDIKDIGKEISHLQSLCYIYETIYNKLRLVDSTGNIGYMADVSAFLYTYRTHLN